MDRWITELEKIIKNKDCLKFYEETILELEDPSYDNICLEIGSVSTIANFENSIYKDAVCQKENTQKAQVLILDLKSINIKIIQTDTSEIYVQNKLVNLKVDKNTFAYNVTLNRDSLKDLKRKNEEQILYIPQHLKVYVKAKHAKISLNNWNNHSTYCLMFTKHCGIKIDNSIFQNLKLIGSSHTRVNINRCEITTLNINALLHLMFTCNNSQIKILGDKNTYLKFSFVHALIKFNNTQIEEVNLNQKFQNTSLIFENCEFYDCEFKNVISNTFLKFKNAKILNYCEFGSLSCSNVKIFNSDINLLCCNLIKSRLKLKDSKINKIEKNCDEKSKWKVINCD